MKNLLIKPTRDTPEIICNRDKNLIEIRGESYSENVVIFFEPLFAWLEQYLSQLEQDEQVTVKLEINYFNSSSTKILIDILNLLDNAAFNGKQIDLTWYYNLDDECALEYAEEYEKDLRTLIFKLIPQKSICQQERPSPSLFASERELINEMEQISQNSHNPLVFSKKFPKLISAYKKLFKQLKNIIRLNDISQRQLKCSQEKVTQHSRELKRANISLTKAKETAIEATRNKSEFLANMSHEIRTPLSGVIAATELALREKIPPEMEHYLKIIDSSSYSLLSIINDILDFSKIEAGKFEIDLHPFILDDIFDRLVDIFFSQAREKKIKLLFDIALDTPRALIGDALRVQQILTNLIGNAFKFTDPGGEISASVKTFKTYGNQKVFLQFSVRDNGVGINVSKLNKLFEPFSQAEISTSRKYGGSGLGLTISRLLVEMMGGKIWAESEPGKGSTFFFYVLLEKQTADNEKKLRKFNIKTTEFSHRRQQLYLNLEEYKKHFQGHSILVVDDNPTNQDIARAMLSETGLRVDSVHTGAEAITAVHSNNYSMVLMDIEMEDMDGYQATREIRKNPVFTSLPIIALTAHALKGDEEKCLTTGMNDYLPKPVRQEVLFKTIAKFIAPMAVKELGEIGETESLIQEAALPGIEISEAMSKLKISREALKKILLKFAEINIEVVEDIKTAILAKDFVLVRRKAHTVKGSSAGIGAYELSDAAWEIEKAINNDDKSSQTLEPLLAVFEIKINQVLDSIKKFCNNPISANGNNET
jgi:signal transduction histidine kinase/CheY-like chemotaxis protein/HPt (histidine-containing phosphotransfer) domain-containing protein